MWRHGTTSWRHMTSRHDVLTSFDDFWIRILTKRARRGRARQRSGVFIVYNLGGHFQIFVAPLREQNDTLPELRYICPQCCARIFKTDSMSFLVFRALLYICPLDSHYSAISKEIPCPSLFFLCLLNMPLFLHSILMGYNGN